MCSEFKISEVAELMGYNDSGYFIKVFKNKLGVPPASSENLKGGTIGVRNKPAGTIRGLPLALQAVFSEQCHEKKAKIAAFQIRTQI